MVKFTTSAVIAFSTIASVSAVTHTGYAIWFPQNDLSGVCGKVHKDSDIIASIDARRFTNGFCNRNIRITNVDNGKSITALVADECQSCQSPDSLGLSKGAFGALTGGDLNSGLISVKWHFV